MKGAQALFEAPLLSGRSALSAPWCALRVRRNGPCLRVLVPLFVVPFMAAPEVIQAQDWATAQISRQLQDEAAVEVAVRYAAGQVTIEGVDSPQLFGMRLRYDAESFQPLHQYENSRAVLGTEGTGRTSLLRRSGDAEMGLVLTTRVPMDLDLDFGAVRATVDLGGLRLRTLNLRTGASHGEIRVSVPNPEPMQRAHFRVGAASFHARELGNLNAAEVEIEAGIGDLRLDFAGLRRPDTRVRIRMGLGNVEIRVPRDVGVQLVHRSLLTSLHAPDLEGGRNELYSSNWDAAPMRIRIELDSTLGKVSLIRFDP